VYEWQGTFRDAFPGDIWGDRGPLVVTGVYLWGPNHGQPVADTLKGHDDLRAW
jgi:hypothetical protein